MKDSFIQRLATGIRYTLEGKSVYNLIPTWQNGVPQYVARSFENNVLYGYALNELIYTCITYKAESAGQVKLKVRKKNGDDLPDEHPLMVMFEAPNKQTSQFDFLAQCIIVMDLAGIVRWEKVKNGIKQTGELHILRPDWLHPIPDEKLIIRGYEYQIPGLVTPKPLKPDDVLSITIYDPLNIYGGQSPVSVAGRVGDVDNAATDFLKVFFDEGGMPPGILTSKQKLQETDVTRIRQNWKKRYGGSKNWQEPAVLDSEATYQQIGSSFKDMGFDSLDARSEARICMVLGVPPILIGAKVGLDRSTFSNYKEAWQSFWQGKMNSQLKRITDALNRDIIWPELGRQYEAYIDYSEVPALQENTNDQWTRAVNAWNANAITRNEFYEQTGLEPIEGDAGDMYKDGTTKDDALQVAQDARQRSIEQFEMSKQVPPKDEKKPPNDEGDDSNGE